MTTVIAIFIAALACALTATPLLRKFAHRIGFLDQPAARKIHYSPVPLLGGVAIYLAVLISILILEQNLLGELLGILMGATITSFTGLMDDRKGIHCSIKMSLQTLTAIGLYAVGVRIQLSWLPWWLDFLLTLLWIVGITNALNLLDNMDGLSAGLCAISSAFFTLFAISQGQYLISALSASVLGACCGFLFFNSHPATIFMGDSGSLLLGFLLACIGIKLRFPNEPSQVTWMIPILVLWIPVFDTTLVTISRLRRGVNPFTASGKDHISHRLVQAGLTQQKAVLFLYAGGILCGLAALVILLTKPIGGYAIGLAVLFLSLRILWRCEFAVKENG